MALVVFIRGVNVGGRRTIRPSVLARGLSDYSVVNVGAAGTFVVRKPCSRAKFRATLLPFKAEVCSATVAILSACRWRIRSEPSRYAPTSFDS
jgi:hypothetical protein